MNNYYLDSVTRKLEVENAKLIVERDASEKENQSLVDKVLELQEELRRVNKLLSQLGAIT